MTLRTSDFHFDLPADRVAQRPVEPRDAARLLVHRHGEGSRAHRHVRDLVEELAPGDLLVVNDTRVVPARVRATRTTGRAFELLVMDGDAGGNARAMVRPAKKLRAGDVLDAGEGVRVTAVEREGDSPVWRVRVTSEARPDATVFELLDMVGALPLPPYMQREADDADRERYQTVYARERGAVAAPTAGLHFTPQLLAALEARGVERASVTLHVGPGTFLPVTVEDADDHEMHAECYVLEQATVDAIEACRARGGRVVAVGTTSVRVLESCVDGHGRLRAGTGETRLFLKPGDTLRVVDGLMTNFHLPESTLLMLVAALIGRDTVLDLYAEALREGYRFYSYGDAMLLLP